MNMSKFLTESFIKYTAITSQSKSSETKLPTTDGQMKLAQQLKKDLQDMGISDITLQDNAILIARIEGTPSLPAISFMAHIDTVDIGASPHVHAQVLPFDGTDIVLNRQDNIIFKVSDYPEINHYKGESIIFTDGTSVLGGDDKAGVTVMMGLAHYLTQQKMTHGDIYLIFVPDEEVGLRGAYALDLDKIPVHYSYTIDGGTLGEFGYETFNGAAVSIDITGVSIHPGSAKGILVNPILVANEIISRLDKQDTPEHSEKKEGFFLVHDMMGNPSGATLDLIIRDFDLDKFNQRKTHIQEIIQEVQTLYPKAQIHYNISDSYANIANTLTEDRACIDLVEQAMKKLNITIHTTPIRGGTDGSVLSAKGRITPNIFTGAKNIHSVFEYLPISAFTKSFETILEMVKILAQP